jgi:Ca2+-binding RTX toxin-like protein
MAYLIDRFDSDSRLQGTDKSDIAFGLDGDDTILTYGRPRDDSPRADYRAQAADTADFVVAGDDDDRVHAGGGKDTVYGGDGDDVVRGGAGADMLAGSQGDDIFVFGWLGGPSLEADTRAGRNARDVILDFESGSDLIDLSGYENAAAPGAVWLGMRAPSATKQLQAGYHFEGNSTVVEIYAPTSSGGGKVPKSVGEIELSGRQILTESDFIL